MTRVSAPVVASGAEANGTNATTQVAASDAFVVRRGLFCLGAAACLHGSLVLASHVHHSLPRDRPCVIASDFVLMESVLASAEAPPQRIEQARPSHAQRAPAAALAPTVAEQPLVAPTTSLPSDSTPAAVTAAPPEILVQAPPSSFEVATTATSGNGTNGTSDTNAANASGSPRGTENAQGAPAIDAGPARQRYRSSIASRIGRPDYTNSMRRRQLEGRVSIGLLVDPSGAVLSVRVRSSSGDDELDENALDHVRAYVTAHRRLDPPPEDAAWGTRELALTYAYDFEDEDD